MSKVMWYTAFLLLLCSLSCNKSFAFVHSPSGETIRFEVVLPGTMSTFGAVEAIEQDSFGFIWIGAKDGLYKYDGFHFYPYTFDRNDTCSLSNNAISALFTDSKGNLWVGTVNGLNRYRVETNDFERHLAISEGDTDLTGNNIRKIIEDQQGNIWIATRGAGIRRYDPERHRFTSLDQLLISNKGLLTQNIRTLFIDSKGIIWLGTVDKGVQYFHTEKMELRSLSEDISPGSGNVPADVRAITEDKDGNIWIGSNGEGLCRFTPSDKNFVTYSTRETGSRFLNSDKIWDITYTSQGVLWVATDGGGLNRFDETTESFKAFQHSNFDNGSISSDVVRILFEDNAGNYWIGHYSAPLNYVNTHQKKFLSIRDILPGTESNHQNKITAIFLDSEGRLWVATDGDGVFCKDPVSGKFKHYSSQPGNSASLLTNKPMCFAEDSRGNIWMGHFEGGLSCFDKRTAKFVQYKRGTGKNTLHGEQVLDLMTEGDTLWIASKDGLQLMDLSRKVFSDWEMSNSRQVFQHQGILKLFRDSKGRLLMATYNGFFVFDPGKNKLQHFLPDLTDASTLSDRWVISLFEDSRKRIWIGTNSGLNLWNEPDAFECFTMEQGLAGNIIESIQEDEEGMLWLSTNRGITRFNYENKEFINYNREDGLVGDWFRPNSSIRTEKGYLYFGGDHGISYFHPKQIVRSEFIPPIVFTGIQIVAESVRIPNCLSPEGKNILIEEELHLRPQQNFFTLYFAALNYTLVHRNQYRYKLEGFEDNWNNVGNQHWASYTNLPPGKYVFHVTGSNQDQVWNEEGLSIPVIIHPPFYKTFWFIALLLLIIAFLVGYIYQIRVSQIRTLNTKLSILVSDRTRELESRSKEIADQNREITEQRDLATAQRDQIVKQNQELEAHRNRLEELIEERTQDLVIAKERAEESDRLKTAFLENLSHQIRTPMNAIIGFINLLSEKIDDKYSRDYYLRIINDSGKSMLGLIQDIIDFSRMQTGQLQPEYNECQVNDLLRELITNYRGKASREKPQLNIVANLPETDIVMYSDRNKLQQIFSKLLENSVKYTEEGHISVGIEKLEEKWITFFVKDTGIGIKPELTEKVFDRFFTVAESDKSDEARGSGLGLAFAKVITELLGGRIWAESMDGQGSVFYFTLPYMKVDKKQPKQEMKEAKKYFWPDKRILVAEDEESNYLLIEAILKDTGVSLTHCEDGVELLEKIDAGLEYDLLLLDLKMPRMGGINAMKIIMESNKNVPVVVQTAYDQTNHRNQCMEIGCSDFLVKPLRKKELLEVLSKYLDEKEIV